MDQPPLTRSAHMSIVKILLMFAVVVSSILIIGYWHSTTHATFFVSLHVIGEPDNEVPSAPEINVQFLDSSDAVLANGVRDKQYNFIHLIHPVHGDCHEFEKTAAFSKEAKASWQKCFEQQSIWIAKWIEDVAAVNVRFGNCLIENGPISVSQSRSGWYLWWIPHPHIGGKPYSNYRGTIAVDEEDCVESHS